MQRRTTVTLGTLALALVSMTVYLAISDPLGWSADRATSNVGILASDPSNPDDDGDTVPDSLENAFGSDPLDPRSVPEIVSGGSECSDGRDNDLDGRVDDEDEGCVDDDNDGWPNHIDNCPSSSNATQSDADDDGIGDDCDDEGDGDGVTNDVDECTDTVTHLRVDAVGCADEQVDWDGDGVCDSRAPSAGPSSCIGSDNCPSVANADQADSDGDVVGDSCDNCPSTSNLDQSDIDFDGVGDLCDSDRDGDNVADNIDTCADIEDVSQADSDGDGVGD